MSNGGVILSGNDNNATEEGDLLQNRRERSALIGFDQTNPRIIEARFKGRPLKISVVEVYAPTSIA